MAQAELFASKAKNEHDQKTAAEILGMLKQK